MEISETDGDYVPPKNIKVFIDQIPGNKDLPLNSDVMYAGLHSQLGDLKELPQQVQNIISEIQSADTTEEKVAIAHNFSQAYIHDELQFGGDLGDERVVSFVELANDPKGDCDDHAKFTAGLLMHGGVDPRNVFILTGMMRYNSEMADMQTAHAFVVIKSENDYLLSDNNILETPVIDPQHSAVDITLADDQGVPATIDGRTMKATAEITFLSSAVDGRGAPFENNEALHMLNNHAQKFIGNIRAAKAEETQSKSPDNIALDFNNITKHDTLEQPSSEPDPQETVTLTPPPNNNPI